MSRFLGNPPALEGGVELAAQRISEGEVSLSFRHDDASLQMRAAWLAVPYPSGLRRLIASAPDLKAVVVERIPRGLDAACREAGVSYLDCHGQGRVVGPGFVYVVARHPSPPIVIAGFDVGDQPDRKRSGRPASSRVDPFAPKASRVVRALLSDPNRGWRLSELAGEVQADGGNAHRILSALIDSGLAERDQERYRVADPGSLLEAWAERARRPREHLTIPVGDDLGESVRSLISTVGADLVVSGEFAAEALAPHLAARRALVHVLSGSAWERVARMADDAEVPPRRSGMIECGHADAGVAQFGSEFEGIPLPHPAQIYVDLVRGPGRGGEAAAHLRREALGY